VIDIETPRLILRLVPLAGLAATESKDIEAACRHIGPDLNPDWFDNAWVAGLRLQQWKDDPGYAAWSIRAMILKATGEIVGGINCHDMPRPFEHMGASGLMIELGYDVFTPWRRQGIATEAFQAMSAFAATAGVRWVRLSISPDNRPSLELAKKLGASKIGTQIDDIDGPEDVYLVALQD
jgi:[ribosomal protein S5]-alanine N-acetyltransferase